MSTLITAAHVEEALAARHEHVQPARFAASVAEPSAFSPLPRCVRCKTNPADFDGFFCAACDDHREQLKADQRADEAREARYGVDE